MSKKMTTIIYILILIVICISAFLYAKYMVRKGIEEPPIDTSEKRM